MKQTVTRAGEARRSSRLDARYFTSPAHEIRARMIGSRSDGVRLGDLGEVFAPARFKRTYAGVGEERVLYLRPYDVFEFLPSAADELAASPAEDIAPYRIKSGDILQSCSGRNLGPVTIADKFLAGFVLSHDMIRIRIEDEDLRHFVLAFLQSPVGQHLLRGDLSGSVIDHITTNDVSSISVPVSDTARVAEFMGKSVRLRESARLRLAQAVSEVDVRIGWAQRHQEATGWTTNLSRLDHRLDAEYHHPQAASARASVRTSTHGVELRELADVAKPAGRYKTYYVDPDHGTPLLSGRQLLQFEPVGVKHISARSIDDRERYTLQSGWICFQADGRADEGLGRPILTTATREGWFASGHVARVMPKSPETAGWLWAALTSKALQRQLKSLAAGSVVDALYPEDIGRVVVPAVDMEISRSVSEAWQDFVKSEDAARDAITLVTAQFAPG